jgi:hypothetical protein
MLKDKIVEILSIIPLDIKLPWKERWRNHDEAVRQLEQLMCNEVVESFYKGSSSLDVFGNENRCVNFLRNKYPESTIKTAIKKYKEENK